MPGCSFLWRFIRNNLFRTTKGRKFSKCGNRFLKFYDDPSQARYEYRVLRKIRRAVPKTFTVPKPLKLIKDRTVLVMECIKDDELQSSINKFLLFNDESALRVFHSLGNAFRELHTLSLNGLRNSTLPSSEVEIKGEIKKLAKKISVIDILDINRKSNAIDCEVDERLFEIVNLHGESYFSHIMISNRKFVFLDLHRACRGPAFYDLATFTVSLYGSLLLPAISITNLNLLVNAFWRGYFKDSVHEESIRLVELYVILLVLQDMLLDRRSFKSKMVNSLKIRKLQNFIGEINNPFRIINRS